jgi:hypothetical protein
MRPRYRFHSWRVTCHCGSGPPGDRRTMGC